MSAFKMTAAATMVAAAIVLAWSALEQQVTKDNAAKALSLDKHQFDAVCIDGYVFLPDGRPVRAGLGKHPPQLTCQ